MSAARRRARTTSYVSVQATDSRGLIGTAADVPVNVPSLPVQIDSITVDRQASATSSALRKASAARGPYRLTVTRRRGSRPTVIGRQQVTIA